MRTVLLTALLLSSVGAVRVHAQACPTPHSKNLRFAQSFAQSDRFKTYRDQVGMISGEDATAQVLSEEEDYGGVCQSLRAQGGTFESGRSVAFYRVSNGYMAVVVSVPTQSGETAMGLNVVAVFDYQLRKKKAFAF